MKKVFISDLKEGMVIGRDTFTSSGILIVPAKVTVTKSIIEHLMSLGLTYVLIDENAVKENELKFDKHKIVEFNKNIQLPRIILTILLEKSLKVVLSKTTLRILLMQAGI